MVTPEAAMQRDGNPPLHCTIGFCTRAMVWRAY